MHLNLRNQMAHLEFVHVFLFSVYLKLKISFNNDVCLLQIYYGMDSTRCIRKSRKNEECFKKKKNTCHKEHISYRMLLVRANNSS